MKFFTQLLLLFCCLAVGLSVSVTASSFSASSLGKPKSAAKGKSAGQTPLTPSNSDAPRWSPPAKGKGKSIERDAHSKTKSKSKTQTSTTSTTTTSKSKSSTTTSTVTIPTKPLAVSGHWSKYALTSRNEAPVTSRASTPSFLSAAPRNFPASAVRIRNPKLSKTTKSRSPRQEKQKVGGSTKWGAVPPFSKKVLKFARKDAKINGMGYSKAAKQGDAKYKYQGKTDKTTTSTSSRSNTGMTAAAKGKGKGKGKGAGRTLIESSSATAAEVELNMKQAALVEAAIQAGENTYKLSASLTITETQLNAIKKAMNKQPTERVFYHWADYKSGIRWGRQRKIEASEMAFFTSSDVGMAEGGGFYIAGNPASSSGYGVIPCYVFVPKDTYLLEGSQAPVKLVLGKGLSIPEKRELGKLIPFIHFYNLEQDWWVTHHADVTRNIRCGNAVIIPDPVGPGRRPDPKVHIDDYIEVRKTAPADSRFVSCKFTGLNDAIQNVRNNYGIHELLKKYINEAWDDRDFFEREFKPAAQWLESFWTLMSYIDGLSLVRARNVSPNNPWSVFDPNNFESYKKTFDEYFATIAQGKPIGLASKNGLWGGDSFTDKETWAVWVVDTFLPKLYNQLSGKTMQYRTTPVRAGGIYEQLPTDPETGYFMATKGQADVIAKNTYLTVSSKPYAGSTTGQYLISYYYPDPLHPGGVVLPALKEEIASTKNYTNPGSDALFAARTKWLMRELLLDSFRSIWRQPMFRGVGDFQGPLEAALRMVSIHPCTDFNGRTTRFFGVIAAMEANKAMHIAYMSDFDIVTDFSRYYAFLTAGNKAYLNLKSATLAELLHAAANGKVPQHFQLPDWDNFVSEGLSTYCNKKMSSQFSTEQNELIRTRKFIEFIDKQCGPAWGGRDKP